NNIEGEAWALLRATDPETTDPNYGDYHFGLDPATVLPDAARALKPRTFMPVRVKALAGTNWVRAWGDYNIYPWQMTVTPEDTILLSVEYGSPRNDLDPAGCLQPGPTVDGSDNAVLELDADGNLLRRWTWSGLATQVPGAAVRDAAGNTYCLFTFQHGGANYLNATLDLDPGLGEDLRTGKNAQDVLVKLDAAGNYVWGKNFGGGYWIGVTGWVPSGHPKGLILGPEGNLYCSFHFGNYFDMDPGPGEALLEGDDSEDCAVAFDNDGNFLWGFGGGDIGLIPQAAMLPSGHVVYGGSFTRDDCDFDPGPAELNLESGANEASFLIEYSPTGTPSNIRNWYGPVTGSAGVTSVVVTGTDRTVVAGEFQIQMDFDPGPGMAIETSSVASSLPYLSSFASDGTFEWVRVMRPPSGADGAYFAGPQIVGDPTGGVTLFDQAEVNDLDIDPGPAEVLVTASQTFWCRFNANGTFDWGRTPDGEWNASKIARLSDGKLVTSWQIYSFEPTQYFDATHSYTRTAGGLAVLRLNADGTW
ncbi:MAG: hypothetical protein ABI743_12705, partial [bacterium]